MSAPHGVASSALRLLNWERAATQAVLLERLEFPEGAELVIAPVLLKVAAEPSGETPLRLQMLLRAVRRDGGVQQWFIGADGRASVGERGFQLASKSTTRVSFGGADYGPVRVDSLERLEVAVALMPSEPERAPLFLGLGAIREVGEADEAGRRSLAADDGNYLIASSLAVVGASGALPGPQSWRIVVVGSAERGRERLAQLHEFDGVRLLDGAGEPVDGLSFVVLDLHITVPDHR
jgi:hypothetical protein